MEKKKKKKNFFAPGAAAVEHEVAGLLRVALVRLKK
jgi:hypothetical protein